MMNGAPAIYVAPMDPVSAEIISPLIDCLSDVFGAGVRTRAPGFDVHAAYDAGRDQYNSTELLERLYAETPEGCKVVGVISHDLFVPVLTFVFGEAQLNGRVAVVSTYRLRSAFYGLPTDEHLLIERLQKEAVHELGHTFGLVHCPLPTCVMYSTTAVEEVDVKNVEFCPTCRREAGLSNASA